MEGLKNCILRIDCFFLLGKRKDVNNDHKEIVEKTNDSNKKKIKSTKDEASISREKKEDFERQVPLKKTDL